MTVGSNIHSIQYKSRSKIKIGDNRAKDLYGTDGSQGATRSQGIQDIQRNK